jgi:hypothetical protein
VRTLRRCKGAGAASRCVIVSWCRWLLMFDVLFPCDCAPTLKEERRLFFPVGFIFAVTSWHAHQNLPASKCARWQRARQSIRFVLSLLGGGVLLRIMMLAERYVPLKNIAVSRSSCVRGHYLLTVNMYFFVSTILKVPTEFFFGIGMVITKKHQPIPTEKYQLGLHLYKIHRKAI